MVEENPAISPATHVPKELAAINSKIITIEQNLSQLADKITNMVTRIKLAEEVTNKVTMLETRMTASEETAKITTNDTTNNRVIMLEGRVKHKETTIAGLADNIRGKVWPRILDIEDYLRESIFSKMLLCE